MPDGKRSTNRATHGQANDLGGIDRHGIHELRHQVGHSEWGVVAGIWLIREPVTLEIKRIDRIVAGELVEDETPGEDIGADAVNENKRRTRTGRAVVDPQALYRDDT